MRTSFCAAFLLLVICAAAPVISATSTPLNYVLKSIYIGSYGDPGDSVYVYGLNDGGRIVGNGALGGFTQKGDDLERFSLPQCPGCALGTSRVNGAGDVAGNIQLTPSQYAGFYLTGGHSRLIKGPTGTQTLFLTSLNNHGESTGGYRDTNTQYHLFLDNNGNFTSFSVPYSGVTYQVASDINDAGEIIGNYIDASGNHGFIYAGGKFTKVDFPFGSKANASLSRVNAHGQIIGVYYDTSGDEHSFLYINSKFTTLTADDWGEMFFSAINDRGDVAGRFLSDPTRIVLHSVDHGFGWAVIAGSAAFPIGTPQVTGLNNTQQIAGTYKFGGGRDCDDECPTVGFLLNLVTH